MYKIKNYLRCLYPLLFFIPVLAAAHFVFGAFYPVYNVLLYFLIVSSLHNLLNKQVVFHNMIFADITAGMAAFGIVFLLSQFQFLLYTNTISRGILCLIGLNQLFMYSRNNFKERMSVRKGGGFYER
jgi:phage-related holin